MSEAPSSTPASSPSSGVVRIVTDSSCDLPAEVAAALGIIIVPLSIRFGDEEFIDREQLTVAEFWTRVVGSDTLPETAAPAAAAVDPPVDRAFLPMAWKAGVRIIVPDGVEERLNAGEQIFQNLNLYHNVLNLNFEF